MYSIAYKVLYIGTKNVMNTEFTNVSNINLFDEQHANFIYVRD